MSTTPERQRIARAELARAFAARNTAFVIHYASEGFALEQPRITCIAARPLTGGQTVLFSIDQERQLQGVQFLTLDSRAIDALERTMLDRFFVFLGGHQNHFWLHWNMRDAKFGFPALEQRYRVLGGQPSSVPDHFKVDLGSRMIDLYGDNYADPNRRLMAVAEMNGIAMRDFLDGPDQAAALAQGDYAAVDRSTLRKVDVLLAIADKANTGR